MNAVAALYGFMRGNVVTEPTLPITDFKLTSHNIGLAYVRSFALFDKLARVQVSVPFTSMAGKLKIDGRDTAGARNGFGDMRVRVGVNLLGSPALDKKDFPHYQQRTIFGVSLVTSVPVGLYYPEKRINIGAHRWAFKPEAGVSHRFRKYTGVWFYTANREFLKTQVQEQRPVFSIQAHGIYYFKNQMWIGANINWFDGGETRVDDVPVGDLNDNWRLGLSWSVPVARFHSVKLQFHTGAFTNSGLDYDLVTIGYQYLFF
jgi:hypothetical protein